MMAGAVLVAPSRRTQEVVSPMPFDPTPYNIKRTRPPIARFLEKIAPAADGCWYWTGARLQRGYGTFFFEGGPVSASRWSYAYFVGAIPVGFEVDHLCENPPCVNPDHLEAVPPLVNTFRATKANANKTHCKRGHEFTHANTETGAHNASGNARRWCKECRRIRQRVGWWR